ncbi:hypothetical protein KSP40_PGU005785 [Platanthera guangdongensis]|uniref:Uncharacterized protein n=1 Tax=Platanthera guangdongensis TaxID=2320717 RepID=A0ABR2MCC9_9ASPA
MPLAARPPETSSSALDSITRSSSLTSPTPLLLSTSLVSLPPKTCSPLHGCAHNP